MIHDKVFNRNFCKILNDSAIASRFDRFGFSTIQTNASRVALIRLVEDNSISDKDLLKRKKGDFAIAKAFLLNANKISKGIKINQNEFLFCFKPILDTATEIILTKDTKIDDNSKDCMIGLKNAIDNYIRENVSTDDVIKTCKNIFKSWDSFESGEDD